MNLAASIHLASKLSRVCAVQPTVARGFSGTRKRSNLLCQAIAEPQTKPISEDQMRIANDVSELIGTLYLQEALGFLCATVNYNDLFCALCRKHSHVLLEQSCRRFSRQNCCQA